MAERTANFVARHVGWGGGVMPAVLMYHSVTPYTHDPYLVTVSPARFRQQMEWLHARGLRGVGHRLSRSLRRAGLDASDDRRA